MPKYRRAVIHHPVADYTACICRGCRIFEWGYRKYLRQRARARKARRGWS